MIPRFFVKSKELNWQDKKAVISDQNQSYKIVKVLRLKENDQIKLLDGSGILYSAQIASFYSRAVQCRLLSRMAVNTEPDLKITIAQSLLKSQKFDYLIQKNTEIGVNEFIPLACERTVIKMEENGKLNEQDNKIFRYQKIAQESAEQSERGIVPKIQPVSNFQDFFKSNLSTYDLKLICQERIQINGIKEVLNGIEQKVQKVVVLIGPEGGFAEQEVKLALSNGFLSVSLGKRILRAETVSSVISGILFFYFNDLR